MKPQELKTRIFLDSSDPDETRSAIGLLGFLDGQTTNPTLLSKHPEVQKRLQQGKKFQKTGVFSFYRDIVCEIAKIIPDGSVSVEVNASTLVPQEEMLRQGREMFSWIPNAHVKFPITKEGLAAAEIAVKERIRVNMTLCFSQAQAAAVYAATQGAKKGDVFVSPFVGRLDDRGDNGMDLIANIIKMYERGDGHAEVLTASVRSLDHLLFALKLGSDIVTAPLKILQEWKSKGMPVPQTDFRYDAHGLQPILYEEMDLSLPWSQFNISHELTWKGVERFSSDWNTLIG